MAVVDGSKHIGEIQAWDMNTGQKAWTRTFESHNCGPVLTTGGGLVFAGGTNDRYFRAFDGKTGEPLWQWRTNSGITGVPSSFAVRRRAVRRGAIRLGCGRAAHVGRARRPSRRQDGRAPRRGDLGIRREAVAVGLALNRHSGSGWSAR